MTLKDSVVQTAALRVLEPIFEADLQPEQYAYRPERYVFQTAFTYAFGGPCPLLMPCRVTPCPGAATCTALPAINGGGPGAMCMKTCVLGTNDGQLCSNNAHCPGGTCSTSGFCRDKCGRCNGKPRGEPSRTGSATELCGTAGNVSPGNGTARRASRVP